MIIYGVKPVEDFIRQNSSKVKFVYCSLSVSFLLRLEFNFFLLETTSNPPRLVGKRIRIGIDHPGDKKKSKGSRY